METIDEKKKMRFEFLRKLYERTNGNKFEFIEVTSIGEELKLDRDSAWRIVYYLNDEGLLEIRTNAHVSIAHLGIIEIEEALTNPEEPTEHFLPVNIIYADTITDSQIQLGGIGNIQITEYRKEDLQALLGIIDSILKDLESFDLQPDDEQKVRADLQTALEQAKSSKPRHDFIKICLKSVFEILKGTAIALAAQHADKLLPFL